jgi:hypothetical protein
MINKISVEQAKQELPIFPTVVISAGLGRDVNIFSYAKMIRDDKVFLGSIRILYPESKGSTIGGWFSLLEDFKIRIRQMELNGKVSEEENLLFYELV